MSDNSVNNSTKDLQDITSSKSGVVTFSQSGPTDDAKHADPQSNRASSNNSKTVGTMGPNTITDNSSDNSRNNPNNQTTTFDPQPPGDFRRESPMSNQQFPNQQFGNQNPNDIWTDPWGSDPWSSNQSLDQSQQNKRLTPQERVSMIEKVYETVLDRKPDSRDINYYKYSTLGEDEIVKQLLDGKEHKQLLEDGRDYKKMKNRAEQAETKAKVSEGQILDQLKEFKHLTQLLAEKNKSIQQLRRKLNNPYSFTEQKYKTSGTYSSHDDTVYDTQITTPETQEHVQTHYQAEKPEVQEFIAKDSKAAVETKVQSISEPVEYVVRPEKAPATQEIMNFDADDDRDIVQDNNIGGEVNINSMIPSVVPAQISSPTSLEEVLETAKTAPQPIFTSPTPVIEVATDSTVENSPSKNGFIDRIRDVFSV